MTDMLESLLRWLGLRGDTTAPHADAAQLQTTISSGGRATVEAEALGAEEFVARVERPSTFEVYVRWLDGSGDVVYTDCPGSPTHKHEGQLQMLMQGVPAWTPRAEVEVIDQAGESGEASITVHLR